MAVLVDALDKYLFLNRREIFTKADINKYPDGTKRLDFLIDNEYVKKAGYVEYKNCPKKSNLASRRQDRYFIYYNGLEICDRLHSYKGKLHNYPDRKMFHSHYMKCYVTIIDPSEVEYEEIEFKGKITKVEKYGFIKIFNKLYIKDFVEHIKKLDNITKLNEYQTIEKIIKNEQLEERLSPNASLTVRSRNSF